MGSTCSVEIGISSRCGGLKLTKIHWRQLMIKLAIKFARLMMGILYNLALSPRESYFGSHAIQENAFETMVMIIY